jgi:hypothetical protein
MPDTPRIPSHLEGIGHVLHELVESRTIRPDKRLSGGMRVLELAVAAGKRRPIRASASHRDWPCDRRFFLGGEARRGACMRTVVDGEATRCGGGDPRDHLPPGSYVRRVFTDMNKVRIWRRDCCPTFTHGFSHSPPNIDRKCRHGYGSGYRHA